VLEKIIDRLPARLKGPAEVFAHAAESYGEDRAPRMAAAIAYRTIFALAPLLMILVAVLGTVLGSRSEAQQEIIDAIEAVVGPEVAEAIERVLFSAINSSGTAALIGAVILLWTASSLFLELQRDLNDIFGTPREKVRGLVAMIRTRGIGFLWVFGLGVVLIAAWFVNAIWRFLATLLPDRLSTAHEVVTILTPIISLVLLPVVFALIFQTMTVIPLPWRPVWIGASFTAVVFVIAAYGIGIYFQIFEPTTALGFAGSFVVVLFLAYFLSSVFLYGAEVTQAYTERLAAETVPTPLPPPYDDPLVLVAAPSDEEVPRVAMLAFLAGLAVGWRRSRR
jgi:membrane protein